MDQPITFILSSLPSVFITLLTWLASDYVIPRIKERLVGNKREAFVVTSAAFLLLCYCLVYYRRSHETMCRAEPDLFLCSKSIHDILFPVLDSIAGVINSITRAGTAILSGFLISSVRSGKRLLTTINFLTASILSIATKNFLEAILLVTVLFFLLRWNTSEKSSEENQGQSNGGRAINPIPPRNVARRVNGLTNSRTRLAELKYRHASGSAASPPKGPAIPSGSPRNNRATTTTITSTPKRGRRSIPPRDPGSPPPACPAVPSPNPRVY